jgi:FkbM family methyltransferase
MKRRKASDLSKLDSSQWSRTQVDTTATRASLALARQIAQGNVESILDPEAVRRYSTLSRVLAFLPPGSGGFRLANHVYRHQMKHLPPGSTVRVQFKSGATFELDLSDWLQAQGFLLRSYAPAIVRFVVEHLRRPEPVFVDVGAHVGMITFQVGVAAARKNASLHAFEPHPRAADLFKVNQQLNPDVPVQFNECGVSEHTGTVTLSLSLHAVVTDSEALEETIDVATVSLDDYFAHNEIDCVDVMKIDVEGHEVQVLKGAQAALADGRIRYVVLEMCDIHYDRTGTSPDDLLTFMSRYGYTRVPLPAVGVTRARPRWLQRPVVDFVFGRRPS